MRERLRLLAAAVFYYSALLRLALWWGQRREQRLIILDFHRAQGGDLRRLMLYLRRHYRLLHLERALEELYAPCVDGQQVSDRRPPLVLTFDDGYHDNYTHAFVLAQELHIPITIFLIPGYIESGKHFWWLEGQRLIRRAQVEEVTIEGCIYQLADSEQRDLLVRTIDNRLRCARSVAEREAFLAAVSEALGGTASVAEDEDVRPLSWEKIREMERSGWVSFGAHTMHHPILSRLRDPAEVRREVEECRTVLERQLGHPVHCFAYPVGKPEDIGEEVVQAVKAAGYRFAVTTVDEASTAQCDPHFIPRLPGILHQHWLITASELVGLLGVVSRLKKKVERRDPGGELVRPDASSLIGRVETTGTADWSS
jgi:peptidoglycan/xylan/chitin deacetylase (PgdA/CDA1 family)